MKVDAYSHIRSALYVWVLTGNDIGDFSGDELPPLDELVLAKVGLDTGNEAPRIGLPNETIEFVKQGLTEQGFAITDHGLPHYWDKKRSQAL